TGRLDHQLERSGDPVRASRQHLHRWGRYADAVARWEHITRRGAPAPAVLNEDRGPRSSPEFVEWLLGLPVGWITDPMGDLTANQQNTALGNGVLPLQALLALRSLGLRME
ncbi:DNA (cytosine-5-)-methyltransferase, partial [Burkholderia multivorans]